jgi:sulfite dehydrogenase
VKRLTLLASLVLALGVAGCGGGGETTATPATTQGALPTTEASGAGKGDPAAGKQVFQSAGCGSCHTLKDAGTTGQIGPNLDDAKPSADKVVERVTNGKGVMPSFKDKLTDKQIQDVAAYVSSVAGK